MENSEQELMYKLSMFEQQIQQVQQQMQAVEQAIEEMNFLNKGLDELIGSKDKEILAPIGRGIYAKTKLLSEELIVDVGEKNFVKKSIPDTKRIITEQIEKLGEAQKDLEKTMEEINSDLTKTMNEAIVKKKGEKEKETCGGGEEDCGCEEESCDCSEDCECGK